MVAIPWGPKHMKLLRLKPAIDADRGPESLASYVVRLAHVHGVTPRQLLRVLSGIDAVEPGAFTTGPLAEILCALTGYGQSTFCWIRRLEKATGLDCLGLCTLCQLHGLLARNVHGMLVLGRRWCPECYRSGGDVTHEPLCWLLSDVQTCSIHGVRLARRCPKCDGPQHVLTTLPERRHCEVCGHFLGGQSSVACLDPVDAWREKETLSLLALLSRGDTLGSGAIGFRTFLREFIHPGSTKLRHLARVMQVDTSNLRRYLAGTCLPSWDTVLRTGIALHVSPIDMLFHPKSAGQQSFDFGKPRTYRRSRLPAPKGVRETLKAKLMHLIDDGTVHLSLADVCRDVGIPKSYAHHLDSKLVAFYGKLHYRWLCDQRQKKEVACMDAARRAIQTSESFSIPQLVKCLMQETGLPKHRLYRAIRLAKSEIAAQSRIGC